MAGLLPDEVRWRRGRQHLGATFTEALRAEWPAWKEPMLAARSHRMQRELLELGAWKRKEDLWILSITCCKYLFS